MHNEWIGFFPPNSALLDYTGPGISGANEMNFGAKHASGAGSITCPVDLMSNTLPLCHGCYLEFMHQSNEYWIYMTMYNNYF